MNNLQSKSETDQPRPAKFYKYRQLIGDSAKYLERTICHNEIYFAAPETFNDPFDCHPDFSHEGTNEELIVRYMDIARRHLQPMSEAELLLDAQEMLADPMRNPRFQPASNAIQDEHARHLRSSIGILCLSAVRDDILMWSHYADFHRGVCLEFDGATKLMMRAIPVSYSQDRPMIHVNRDSSDTALEKSLLTKADQWRYEHEWRLLRYTGGPGVVQFRPEDLTGVVIGAEASSDTVDLVRGWVNRRATPINVYRATKNRHAFALDIIEITI